MEIPVGFCLPGPTAPSTGGYSRRAPEMQRDGGVSSDPPSKSLTWLLWRCEGTTSTNVTVTLADVLVERTLREVD